MVLQSNLKSYMSNPSRIFKTEAMEPLLHGSLNECTFFDFTW